jgi:GR25 family glycosyltransferase involved in LPS biosynthesis
MFNIPTLYINLDKRKDRKKQIEEELQGFKHVERIEAVDTSDNGSGYYGCVLSHINALETAKERGWDEVMICEDDFEFVNKDRLVPPKIKYDVCMLEGDIVDKSFIDWNYNKVEKGLHTGCYIVKKHYYDTLIDCFKESYDKLKQNYIKDNYLDVYWNKLQVKDNFITPSILIGRQRESYSNIQNKNIKRYLD